MSRLYGLAQSGESRIGFGFAVVVVVYQYTRFDLVPSIQLRAMAGQGRCDDGDGYDGCVDGDYEGNVVMVQTEIQGDSARWW